MNAEVETEAVPEQDLGPPPMSSRVSSWQVAGWLMPRAVALCFVLAFWSWGWQCVALVGNEGVMPAVDLMKAVQEAELRDGKSYFMAVPTVFRWGCSDAVMVGACWAGGIAAGLAMVGLVQGWALLVAWILYLSLMTTGQTFMSFQWDALMLESGAVVLFLASWTRLWHRGAAMHPSRVGVFLVHWLVFRLMLLSGVVKLWGGDTVWEDGTALMHHFETQPLPTPLAWWADQLPASVLQWGCWGMYGVELILPLVMWLGRWGRLAASLGYVGLMLGVALTGNYNFFNLLTALLALSLVQDGWWPNVIKRRLLGGGLGSAKRWLTSVHAAVAAVLVLFSLVAADTFLAGRTPGYERRSPEVLTRLYGEWLAPLSLVNAYGLFQDMTEERLEVEVEVSEDGATFFPLRFKWKPSDTATAPRWVAPYQPRLDWQMWFAALSGGYQPQRDAAGGPMQWFGGFMSGVANGRAGVWSLIDEANTLVKRDAVVAARASLWRYRFTTPDRRRETGDWWERDYLGNFSPTFRRVE